MHDDDYYRRVIKEYTRPARVLFLFELLHQRPNLKIEDPDAHMSMIMIAVCTQLKDADKNVWPPEKIHTILHRVVNEYIRSLPGI